MRISDWSSDVCSSDLRIGQECTRFSVTLADDVAQCDRPGIQVDRCLHVTRLDVWGVIPTEGVGNSRIADIDAAAQRSEEHTSELQSLMRISYAVFCLQKKQHPNHNAKHQSRFRC